MRTWTLDLPVKSIAQFDYDTISDVVVHIDYEAEDAGNRKAVTTYVESHISGIVEDGEWPNMISLNQQFGSSIVSLFNGEEASFAINKKHFAYLFRDKDLTIKSIDCILIPKEGVDLNGLTSLEFTDGITPKTMTFSQVQETVLGELVDTDQYSGSISDADPENPLNMNLELLTITKTNSADTIITADKIQDICLVVHFEAAIAS